MVYIDFKATEGLILRSMCYGWVVLGRAHLLAPTSPGFLWVKKVKKVKFAVLQATKVQRWSRGMDLSFFKLSARWGGWSKPRLGYFTPRKEPVHIV